jgi:hypothetical protein
VLRSSSGGDKADEIKGRNDQPQGNRGLMFRLDAAKGSRSCQAARALQGTSWPSPTCMRASAAGGPPATKKAPNSASMASASTLLLFCRHGKGRTGGMYNRDMRTTQALPRNLAQKQVPAGMQIALVFCYHRTATHPHGLGAGPVLHAVGKNTQATVQPKLQAQEVGHIQGSAVRVAGGAYTPRLCARLSSVPML